jgi:L-2-hydroxyglutarate oxidase LhgO
MSEHLDCAVIGAGVIGLAIARALARTGRDVIVLEAEGSIGTGASSRNSEVIHAGMYYAPGSLKARLCVAGSRMLRQHLAQYHVDHRLVGKLIVATNDAEEAKLAAILDRARDNGVESLHPLSRAEVHRLEPEVRCTAALHSPLTGILDTHGYMLSLQGDLEANGGMIAFRSPVLAGHAGDDGIALEVGGDAPMRLMCRCVVNAAGLGAQAIGRAIAGPAAALVPPRYLCKGNYFLLSGRFPFSRLVYPTPVGAGLGTHFTLDLAGQGRFGPDVEWVEQETYDVAPERGDVFYDAVRRYWPGLADGALRPGFAGIRSKVTAPGEAAADFLIQGPGDHGIAGLVHLYGMESPGLTASLAIADYVRELLA